MLVGGYTAHIYCESKDDEMTMDPTNPHYKNPQLTLTDADGAKSDASAIRVARRLGWQMSSNGDVCLCPRHRTRHRTAVDTSAAHAPHKEGS